MAQLLMIWLKTARSAGVGARSSSWASRSFSCPYWDGPYVARRANGRAQSTWVRIRPVQPDAEEAAETSGYRRLEAFSSAYKELQVSPNRAFGLQVSGTYGTSWGTLPVYSAYYAGNNDSSFLYSDRQSLLTNPPMGPVVRSLGAVEGSHTANAGSATFVGLNGALSIPVRRWSRPLIPDAPITPTMGLKKLLKNSGIVSARSLLEASLVQQGMSAAEARTRAQDTIDQEVAPTVRYVADDANLYAVKPLIVADWAHMGGQGAATNPAALGGGVELSCVNVALQAGYARTVKPRGIERKGNVFLELQFLELF